VAAGGLRRPPTKSPNRIPFGFRASLHRVNNVFTRRFGSFAVERVSFSSLVLLGALLALHAAPLRVFPSGPFLIFFSSSFASVQSVRAPYAVDRPACCTFHGCLQLRIMNIDNTAGREETDNRSNVNISATSWALATRVQFSVFASARYSACSLSSVILLFRRPLHDPVHFAELLLPATSSAREHSC